MNDLEHKIARIIKLWDDDFGGPEVPAAAILALPEIAEAFLALKTMDRLEILLAEKRDA